MFDHLKTFLTTNPVLKLYRINPKTEVHTNALMLSFAAILLQKDSVT